MTPPNVDPYTDHHLRLKPDGKTLVLESTTSGCGCCVDTDETECPEVIRNRLDGAIREAKRALNSLVEMRAKLDSHNER